MGFQAATPPTLVAYYKLDEAAGNTAADSSGGGFNGTWQHVTVGTTTCVQASATGDVTPFIAGDTHSVIFSIPPGIVAGTTFVAGGYIDVPSNAAFTFTGPFTAMAWIKPSAYVAGDNPNDTGAIIQKWNWLATPGTTNGYGMNRNLNGTISFWMGDTTQSNILTGSMITPVGVWSHVAIVFTGTGRQIYVNGVLNATDSYTHLGASTADLHIGLDDYARNFYGNVDEVRIYNGAMTASEIQMAGMNQNMVIGVGNPGPVSPQYGLLGEYFNFTTNPPPPGSPPGSPVTPNDPTAVQFLQRVDQMENIDFTLANPPGNPGGVNNFEIGWTGFINVPVGGAYNFYVGSDDGERSWFGNPTNATPDPSSNATTWTQRGVVFDTYPPTGTMTLTAGKLPVRFDYEQGVGGTSMEVQWKGPAPFNTQADVPWYYLLPPDGPAAPGNLMAQGSNNSTTPSVSLSWNTSTTPIAATSYILSRGTTSGGPYTQIAVQTGTTFTDTNVVFGTTYYYIVQGTANLGLQVGPASAEVSATCILPPISVSPGGPITTTETGGNVNMTLTVNVVPTSTATVTITSSNTSGATVGLANQAGTGMMQITVPSGTPVGTTFGFVVYGVDDFIANDPQTYTITITVAGGGYTSAPTQTVNGTTLEGDVAGIVAVPSAGLQTNTNGAQAFFNVTLSSEPSSGGVSIAVSSSNVTEGTVSPSTLTFTQANWNTPQQVTVTGQGVNITYINTPYTVNLAVQPGSAPEYVGMTASVSVLNIHLEVPPALPKVWGNCGLLGPEAFLPLGLLAILRRRKRGGR